MDINSLTSDDIMSELFKIWDSKVRSKPRLTDDQGLLAKNLLQALPLAISSSCSISTTSASAPLITSQHQADNANPRTYAEAAKCKGNITLLAHEYRTIPSLQRSMLEYSDTTSLAIQRNFGEKQARTAIFAI
ncbi:hypothetical protein AVEN_149974-1 [Araneus ventricosus]|uniref:Uncharacterized protein n=1 Tax=Araneus ventricosus TaxID=182803 RepID=A0A4Y2WZG8_ARAVE|nr:hypothetical protein AVEN_149974-1 [Araneus ventricosus]